jgi:hypothetical protein
MRLFFGKPRNDRKITSLFSLTTAANIKILLVLENCTLP